MLVDKQCLARRGVEGGITGQVEEGNGRRARTEGAVERKMMRQRARKGLAIRSAEDGFSHPAFACGDKRAARQWVVLVLLDRGVGRRKIT